MKTILLTLFSISSLSLLSFLDSTTKTSNISSPSIEVLNDSFEVDTTLLIYGGTCEADFLLAAIGHSSTDCNLSGLQWELILDLNSDWSTDYVFSSANPSNDPNYGTTENELFIPVTQDGDTVRIRVPEAILASEHPHRVIWKMTDGCGNNTSTTRDLIISDLQPPIGYSYDTTSIIINDNETMTLNAIDFFLGAFDNCDSEQNLLYTFFGPDEGYFHPHQTPGWDASLQTETYDFSCEPDLYEYLIKLYVWDSHHNASTNYTLLEFTCTLTSVICDPATSFSGNVKTEYGDLVNDISVTVLSNQPEFPQTLNMDANWCFNDFNSTNQDYIFSVYKDGEDLLGVDTRDIIKIQRHLSGIESLKSPYQMIAADANADSSINKDDIDEILNLILGDIPEFLNNTSWRFVDAYQELTVNNWMDFEERVFIESVEEDIDTIDFIGVKIGDVSNDGLITDSPSGTHHEIKDHGIHLMRQQSSDSHSITLVSTEEQSIHGFQFSLDIGDAQFLYASSDVLSTSDVKKFITPDSKMTVSWSSPEPLSVHNEKLLTLYFTESSHNIVLKESQIKAVIYDEQLNVKTLGLLNSIESNPLVAQVFPNPFNTNTEIVFDLDSDQNVSIEVYDQIGRLIHHTAYNLPQGQQKIKVRRSDLGGAGYYTYRLKTESQEYVGKLTLVD